MSRFDKTAASDCFDHYVTSIKYLGSAKRSRKVAELVGHLKQQEFGHFRAAVIGPGGGIEVSALLHVQLDWQICTSMEIICFDISKRILDHLRQAFACRYDRAELRFIRADARHLPSRDASCDLVISSSLEHEVYSYQGGESAIRASIGEYCRILAPDGTFFLRDFAPPPCQLYAIRLDSEFARGFWHDYAHHFRRRYEDGVVYELHSDLVLLNSYEAIDFVTHLAVKLLYDPDHQAIKTWKEINERYIVLPLEWYVREITKRRGFRLILLSIDRETEQEEVIRDHVSVFAMKDGEPSRQVSRMCERFNLLFRKTSQLSRPAKEV